MTILSTLALAQTLARATDAVLVVVDANNAGGSLNWSQTFPSLDEAQTDALGEPFAIAFDDRREAQDFFTTLCRDAGDGSRLIGGTISYVSRDAGSIGRFAENATVETVTFDIGDDHDHPAFENGVLVRHEIVSRI